ncbi:hypothetical protein ACRALDRAFT_213690 [Sodiomyces alcalophilus JCM 7366]|uniref:uncharacterized protein n=1 Tax=Sodiomyces alcalophilus JCM 7366 TaxID=591952 RepID=UPI0039B3B17D
MGSKLGQIPKTSVPCRLGPCLIFSNKDVAIKRSALEQMVNDIGIKKLNKVATWHIITIHTPVPSKLPKYPLSFQFNDLLQARSWKTRRHGDGNCKSRVNLNGCYGSRSMSAKRASQKMGIKDDMSRENVGATKMN